MIIRAATENPDLARALGYQRGPLGDSGLPALGVALAGLAGVLAAPFRAITADMGNNFAIILFAVVVIGGLGSIVGAVVAGFMVGLVEAFGQAYAPTFSQIVIFVMMALIILVRPAGLFGLKEDNGIDPVSDCRVPGHRGGRPRREQQPAAAVGLAGRRPGGRAGAALVRISAGGDGHRGAGLFAIALDILLGYTACSPSDTRRSGAVRRT
jgi:hypothetical protein